MKEALHLDTGWEVAGVRTAEEFFRALGKLLPLPVYLYFEGTSIAPDVWPLLQSRAVAPLLAIPIGTIWPKPKVAHVLATESFFGAAADAASRHAEPEICDHLHAYTESGLLLQWYDAFFEPLQVAESIQEEAIREFCATLGAQYRRLGSRPAKS